MSKQSMLCPCCSGLSYEVCCKPFHEGALPEHALQLMRSRYSAYARCLPEYIIQTTHPNNPHHQKDHAAWMQQIRDFSTHTRFQGLAILDSSEIGTIATVTFTAHIIQQGKEASFTEKSTFEKVGGKWLYRDGKIISR